jgi:hypothetical protein
MQISGMGMLKCLQGKTLFSIASTEILIAMERCLIGFITGQSQMNFTYQFNHSRQALPCRKYQDPL